MSRAAKLTLTGASLFAVSTIIFVHYAQRAEKAVRLLQFPFLPLPFPPFLCFLLPFHSP
jgi:hypothetical protein